jgi:p-cumate 2,3-dioxygenase subunit beta
MNEIVAATVSRAEVEDLFYHEADLLDNWRLDEWLTLLTDDASYYVPPNDKPDADARFTLFTIADDIVRLRERVIRLKDPNCHAEFPLSRRRRISSFTASATTICSASSSAITAISSGAWAGG